jgi:hypothetical protein
MRDTDDDERDGRPPAIAIPEMAISVVADGELGGLCPKPT